MSSEEDNKSQIPQRVFDLDAIAVSDIGRRRQENQDAYGSIHSKESSVFIVADGMGGARGGARASSYAVGIINELVFSENDSTDEARIKYAINTANAAIYSDSRNEEDLSGMGTTVVLLAFIGERAMVAHVGDSRIYKITNNEIIQLTKDHTLVQELVDSGAIKPEEAENHPISHMLTRSLGPSEKVDVECRSLEETPKEGDSFLLCSDGLYNHVNDAEIAEFVQKETPEEAAKALIALALERGGTDNVTVQILRVLATEPERASGLYPAQGCAKTAVGSVEIQGLDALLARVEVAAKEEQEIQEIEDSVGEQAEEEGYAQEPLLEMPERDLAIPVPDADVPSIESSLDVVTTESTNGFWSSFQRHALTAVVLGLSAGALVYAGAQYNSYKQFNAHRAEVARVANEKSGAVAKISDEIVSELNDLAYASNAASTKNAKGITLTSEMLPSQLGSLESLSLLPSIDDKDFAHTVDELKPGKTPRVTIPGISKVEPSAVRPIVWENEKKRIDEENSEEKKEESLPAPPEPAATAPLLSDSEKLSVAEDKAEVRREIGDVDAKIRALAIRSEKDSLEKVALLDSRIAELSIQSMQVQKQVEGAEAELVFWKGKTRSSKALPNKESLEKLSAKSPEIKTAHDAFKEASKVYYESVDRWDAQPNDISRAAAMGENGRKLQQLQLALQEAINLASTKAIEKAAITVALGKVKSTRLSEARDQLSKHGGYFRAYINSPAAQRKELLDEYLSTRKSLLESLEELSKLLSDRDEVRFRRSIYYNAALAVS